jgi:hypothetical protein
MTEGVDRLNADPPNRTRRDFHAAGRVCDARPRKFGAWLAAVLTETTVMRSLPLTLSMSMVTMTLIACASTPGAKPHDMSAAQHEAMAKEAEQASTIHTTQYDPSAAKSVERCGSGGAHTTLAGPCWTSTVNPTAEHQRIADEYKKAAADHRAASQVLRDAEARACAGIDDSDRDTSPFAHREDVVAVETLTEASGLKANAKTIEGAVVTFRAVPGLTQQWLQREIDCHIARNAAMGHDAPEMASCPLQPKGIRAEVTATRDGFAVAIRASDPATASEVVRRAEALRARP